MDRLILYASMHSGTLLPGRLHRGCTRVTHPRSERGGAASTDDTTIWIHGYDKYKRRLPTCSYPMAPTSTTRWSKRAGTGDIASTRQEMRCWKG